MKNLLFLILVLAMLQLAGFLLSIPMKGHPFIFMLYFALTFCSGVILGPMSYKADVVDKMKENEEKK